MTGVRDMQVGSRNACGEPLVVLEPSMERPDGDKRGGGLPMKPASRLVAFAVLLAAPLVVISPAVHAQSPAQITITFRLSLTGSVPPHDIFLVTFPVNGGQFCDPCIGGRTYEVKVPWARGTDVVTFQFDRFTLTRCAPIGQGSVSCPPGGQHVFAQVNVRPTASQTITAFYAYGNAPVGNLSVPATGVDAEPLAGSALIASGAGLLGLAIRRRKWNWGRVGAG